MQSKYSRTWWRTCAALAALLLTSLLTSLSHAGVRCGNELIIEGDSVMKLLEACGEPFKGNARYTEWGDWIYNFGPNEFMVKAVIRDHKVERIEMLGKGFVEDAVDADEAP